MTGRRRVRRARQAGQIVPVMMVAVIVVAGGGVAAFLLSQAHVAGARAQSVADVAALTAGRALQTELGATGGGRAGLEARLATATTDVVERGGGRVERLRVLDGGDHPLRVQVIVGVGGPMGTRVRAAAAASVVISERLSPQASAHGWAQGGGYRGPLVYRDGKPMCPSVAAAFDLMRSAARADGVDLVVNSGFRSDAEQAILFARNPDPRWVAPPGRSRHRDATELDINMGRGGAAHPWLARNAMRFGFAVRYSWEPWHIGYLPGCGTGAAPSAGPGRPRSTVTVPAWAPPSTRPIIAAAATQHGIDPRVLAALLSVESGFRADAVSPAGARGIAQFTPATARQMGLDDPFDPTQAIPAAAALLARHIREFGSMPLALAAYNAGPGAVRRHGGVPPYPETQSHIARVLSRAGLGAAFAGGASDVILTHVEGFRL